MSTRKSQREKDIGNIRALLRKLERGGENIQTLLWQFMDEFDIDEYKNEHKNEEKQYELNNDQPSLLMNPNAPNMCNKGHTLHTNFKHLGTKPCIECGHVNTPNKSNQTQPTKQQIQAFLQTYNVTAIPYGPVQQKKKDFKILQENGWDKKWPLHFAASICNTKQIQTLCEMDNTNINQRMTDWNDNTPMDCASYYGQLPAMVELIKYAANPIPTPNTQGNTPYAQAIIGKDKSILAFYEKYMKFVYNININDEMNRQCNFCYMFHSHFNMDNVKNRMANYVYCFKCSQNNVEKIKIKKENSKIMSARIIKILQKYPEISVDTLCQMKDVKAMDGLLKEIIVSGQSIQYTLWLLDIDNFKSINSALTHSIADTKIQAVGNILKRFEGKTQAYWRQRGVDGVWKIWCFRQGGDEFALVVWGNSWKYEQQQKIYEMLRTEVHKVKVENMQNMTHITVSIGVCIGTAYINDYSVMIKKADEMVETVKKEGKDGIKIYWKDRAPFIFKSFNDAIR